MATQRSFIKLRRKEQPSENTKDHVGGRIFEQVFSYVEQEAPIFKAILKICPPAQLLCRAEKKFSHVLNYSALFIYTVPCP